MASRSGRRPAAANPAITGGLPGYGATGHRGPVGRHARRQTVSRRKEVAWMDETTRPSPDSPRAGAAELNEPTGQDVPDGRDVPGGQHVPGGPARTGGSLWRAAARRTLGEFTDDQL